MVLVISGKVFLGVLQTEQKYIKHWREAIEVEMNNRQSETCHRPSGAQYLEGWSVTPVCKR